MKNNASSKWITFEITNEWDQHTVEEILKGPLMISGRMINRLTRSKGIRLNGKTPWLQKRVKIGERLQVAVRPLEKSNLPAQPVDFQLVYEDMDLMVINKPAGVAVHPVKESDQQTLAHGIVHYWQQHGKEGVVRPVHRLDRWTSGLILIAKNAYIHQLLDRQLKEKQIKRTYLALTSSPLTETKGTIDEPIGRDPHHPTRRRVTPSGDRAITHYEVLKQNEAGSMVKVELETGKTHQIRVHFAHLGAPLLGDRLYGGDCSQIQRQALHSAECAFHHPLTGEELSFIASLPKDMAQLVGAEALNSSYLK